MQSPRRESDRRRLWPLILAVVMVCNPAAMALGSSLLYKNYIVRYDRGWDILCEPYVVKKNDWILKIFRQKGEIAHQDFREFSGIFKRLNPHIKDINMIRPGQGIDIPLRKIEHGTLPGQDVGVVTIPFVALKQVKEVVKKHSDQYVVQRGDTVSKLIARKYGSFGTRDYNEGVKLFKAANPNISDINRIYAGQKLHLPDPTIREKSWYGDMYDEKGDLKKTVDQVNQGGKTPESPSAETAPTAESIPAPAPSPTTPKGNLAEAAAFVGGQLQTKGTYYLPRAEGDDFEMDLSKHPTLNMGKGPKLVFTENNSIMDMDNDSFHANWPRMKPVTVQPDATTEQYVAAIFQAIKDQQPPSAEELTFDTQGVHVSVRAKWVRSQGQGRHLCITPISGPEHQTPIAIRRYLEQNGITVKELLPGGAELASGNASGQRHSIKNILAIAPDSQKDFVKTLAKALKFSYVPNTIITFPYAGIQVQAYANLLSAKNGAEILVDFGDLYGDAVNSIGETGLKLVRISADDTYDGIIRKIFSALAIRFEQSPTLLAVQRPGQYNTAITINGVLYADEKNKQTLLTGADLHSAVTDMLSDRGIDVVVW